MELAYLIAIIAGFLISTMFFVIKNKHFVNADRLASQTIGLVDRALKDYGDYIKEYDKENGTDYFESLSNTLKTIHEMEQDTKVSALSYALYVISLAEDIHSILVNTSLYDKVVEVDRKEPKE